MRRLLSFSLLAASTSFLVAQSNIDATQKFAYGANVGWINMRGNDSQGVVVGEHYLSGAAWGSNVGWIGFGDGSPANKVSYSNTTRDDFGVNHDGKGNLSGMAYGANIGWINFDWASKSDPDRPRLDLATGEFSGFAYGANIGWINLGAGRLVADSLDRPDTDQDEISDPWEQEHFGNLTTAGSDTDKDNDGTSDRDEYFGGTDPNDPQSFLRILAQENEASGESTRTVTLQFTSSPTRRYRIMVSSDLDNFKDSGLGEFAPSAEAFTTKSFAAGKEKAFYRVVAVSPLRGE